MRALALLLLLAGAAAAADVEYGEDYRLKIKITGETRKGFLFIPKGLKKNETLPLLIAIPAAEGLAGKELGQWQQFGHANRFAVFSVDSMTARTAEPWHWKDTLLMQRDMEAVLEGLKVALAKAKEVGATIDQSAIVMTGHSGGTYLTLWLGVRRSDLFLGICGRSCVFFKETLRFSEFENVTPKLDIPIFLYHGENDAPRSRKDTVAAKKALKAAGYTNVEHSVVPKMVHESKPEVCLEWFVKLLKSTAKGRKESAKVAAELAKLEPHLDAGKAGTIGKLARLAEREQKAGFPAGAIARLAPYQAKADAAWQAAEALAKEEKVFEAVAAFKQIEKTFAGLDIAKQARTEGGKVRRSDAYKAAEMLAKAKKYLESGKRDKAAPILEKLVDKYAETAAGKEARFLLEG